MTDHAKRIWLHAIAIVAKARNKCAPGERFEALNLVMGDLEDARRRDQLIMPDFPAVCPDCGQHCETHNGESDCAALQSGEAQEGWVEREGRLAQYGDEFATPPAPQVTVADCIAALKAMPTRTEALGGQDFKYIQLGEALDTLRALAGDGRRRQMKALIVGGPDRGQVVDVQDDDPRVDRVLMGSHVHNFIVDADVPNPREYVMRELCRAYEYLMKGETHRQHIKKNGKL